MLLAQSFEDICKRTLIWWNAAKRISDGEQVDIERIAIYPETFMEKFLGIALGKLAKEHTISEENTKILTDAKNARNYLAHKAAHPCLLVHDIEHAIEGELVILKDNVFSLANGHNILACWAYEFEEREPRPIPWSLIYPKEVTNWILSPIYRVLKDC